jgi:ribosomal protein L11 methyltransferase
LEGIATAPFDRPALELALALAAAAAGIDPPVVVIEALPERDWLAENRDRFAAFRIGMFRIREPDDATACRSGLMDLRIEAATAFGSGRHGSTEGCLRALSSLASRRIRRPIDIGCGSGILAIAAAKLWRSPVLACDIDATAVAVGRDNAKLNRVASLVRFIKAEGWRSTAIAAAGPYDLVMCNILARPLKRMAAESFRHTAPGGMAVLSGLLVDDSAEVLACYQAVGFGLIRRIDVNGWRTLLLRRRVSQA